MYTRCPRRVATLPAHILRRQVRSSLVCKRYLETQPIANESGLSAGLDSASQELVDIPKVQESNGSSAQRRRIRNEKYGAIFYTSRSLNLRGMFAFLRGVESRFGSIKDFKFHQDRDSPTEYISLSVNFTDSTSIQKMEELNTRNITIQLPPGVSINENGRELEGGVCLEDISEFLKPASFIEDASTLAAVTNVEEVLEDSSQVQNEDNGTLSSFEPLEEPRKDITEVLLSNDLDVSFIIHDRGSSIVIAQNERRFRRDQTERIRISRSFISWGGFYPYNFSKGSSENQGAATENTAVHTANELMRKCIYNARLFLYERNEPNSGIVDQNGKKVVLEWEKEQEVVSPLARDDFGQDADSKVLDQLKESLQKPTTTVDAFAASTEPAPGPLSDSEKATLERLYSRMNPSAQHTAEDSNWQELRTQIVQPMKLAEKQYKKKATVSKQVSKSPDIQPRPKVVKKVKTDVKTPDNARKASERSAVQAKQAVKKAPKQLKKQSQPEPQQPKDDFKSRILRTFGFGP